MNAMILQAAQAEQQAFLKQQQKIIQSIPANSPQRKAYEAMFSEMKQALELSSKLGSYGSGGSHDAKVNKWLAEQTAALTEQALSMEYLSKNAFAAMGSGSGSSSSSQARRSSQQSSTSSSSNMRQRSNQSTSSQAQAQADANAMANINWNSLTGEESVSVIHKSTGKRLSGRSAPQLKRLSQWLKENPMYEIDPKWTESLAMPSPSAPHSSGSSMNQKMSIGNDPSYSKASSMSRSSASSSSSQYGSGHAGSSASGSHKKQAASSSAASNLSNFQGLTGLNANLLSGLPGLGNFDPKNPLSSIMPFAGMPGLGSMGNMNNLNNMNLFGNIAALGGLAGMDAQSLAAVMAAASLDPSTAAALAKGVGPQNTSSQSSSNKSRKSNEPSSPSTSQHQSTSSKQSASQSAASAANLANSSGFPFFFPNPSLLYTPLGLSGLNPYSLPGGISAYDQLAQQCNLLNGGALSGAQSGTTSTSTSSRQNSSSKNLSTSTSASRSVNSSQSTPSPSNKGSRGSNNMNSLAAAAARDAQLQSLLLPHDTHLLESLSRATGLDITQSSSRSNNSSSQEKRSNAAQQANKDALEKLERDRRKLLEQLTRNGFPTDFATMQALAKMPAGLGASSSAMPSMKSKDLPVDFSQALFAEMMAQTAAAVSTSSSKRSRDQDMKDALEQLSKNPVEMLARSLGVGPGISLIPTSSASSIHDAKKMRRDSSSSSAAISLTPTSSKISDMKSLSMSTEELKSPRSSRTESLRHHDQQDKITLTPVSAASIGASLPSQTTISLSTSSGSGNSTREREASQEKLDRHSSPQRTHQQPSMLPSPNERDAEVSRKPSTESLQQQHDPNMDIEDLIAQSKVSKGGELQQEEQHNDLNQRKSDENSQDQNEQQQDENTGDEGERRTARRTRSKRPRSGDDVDVSMPERKRELRSSAGRLAAAAAARMAAEAKMAAQQAAIQDSSLNLSNSSDGSKDDGNAE